MACECIRLLNETLASRNAVLVVHQSCSIDTGTLGAPMATIAVCPLKLKKRGRLPVLVASFCPFCGRSYESEDPRET